MMLSGQQRALAHAQCEVAFDNATRQLYATDASLYQVEPLAVAFPRTGAEAASVVRAARDANVSVIPRGAGTGLVGGALGEGLILDLARHNRAIHSLDLERRTVRVGAGVVLDELNAFLKPHGYCFGPDVATSSRATLGGMIANNSSGARVPVYGTTADHLISLEILTADGEVLPIGPGLNALPKQQEVCAMLVQQHADEIARRMPPGLLKRWPGYALDRFARESSNLLPLLAGSEGTLAGILSAELRILPLPKEKGLGLIFFASVSEAMQATVELLDLKPAAIEHVDRVLLDQTRGQLPFQAARDLMELESKPCASILIVELYEDVAGRLQELQRRRLGLRTLVLRDSHAMGLVWALRKAGLSLLTSRPGPAKPVTCVEDTAVRPKQLPEYVRNLESIFKPLDVEVCYYGHAAAGLLHVRPVLDLHKPQDVRKLRFISDQVAALVHEYKGSLAGEHGVGMARTEYLSRQLGPELIQVMREIKHAFDPHGRLNPGKIIDDGRFRIDTHLRVDPQRPIELPFAPVLAFARKDGTFLGNLEQCNGCGGCRKLEPTMCPTFPVTGDEALSTRGRANLIRAILEKRDGSTSPGNVLESPELDLALKNCLGCKACLSECPSNVDMALLKAELLHARHERLGMPLRERLLSRADQISRLGCLVPGLANAALRWPLTRKLLQHGLDLAAERRLPEYAAERFDRWFARRTASSEPRRNRGEVILWDDTFVRYHEPQIGIAAVRVLEAAGFNVLLPRGRKCCGRPAFSQGHLRRAAGLGRHNVALLAEKEGLGGITPIVFLEPSCYSMFIQEYQELRVDGAAAVAARCFLFEQFLANLLDQDPSALRFQVGAGEAAIHAHCHTKSLTHPGHLLRLTERLPGKKAVFLNTGCCGMAGAFGMLEQNQQLSRKVAEPLVNQINLLPRATTIIASGTSCRQQIAGLTNVTPLHMAQWLARQLA